VETKLSSESFEPLIDLRIQVKKLWPENIKLIIWLVD